MKRFFQKNRNILILWGLLIIFILIAINVWKHQIITSEFLANNKDAIDAVSAIITTMIVIIGAFMTYYRFFKGRTFSLRGQIQIKVNVHNLDENKNLHVVKVLFKNVGSSAIFNPKLKLIVDSLGGNEKQRTIDQWFDPGKKIDDSPRMYFIDPEESASFLTHVQVFKESSIVIYTAVVSSEDKTIWQDATSVDNSIISEKDF